MPNTTILSNQSLLSPSNPNLALQNNFAIAYSVFGILAILSNTFIILVLISNRRLLKRSAILMGVTGSHLFSGLAIGVTGVFRTVNAARLTTVVRPWDCVRLVFPIFFPLTFQTMTTMLPLVGVERLLATVAHNWFYKNWTPRLAWSLVLGAYTYVIVPMSFALYSSNHEMANRTTSLSCLLPAVFGFPLVIWNFGATICAGVLAVTMTMVSYQYGIRRILRLPLLSGERGRLNRQLRLTRAMLTVACLDFALVVVPNIFVFLASTRMVNLSLNVTFSTNLLYCLNSCLTVFSLLAFHSDFKRAAFEALKKWRKTSAVITPNNHNDPQQQQNGLEMMMRV